MYKKFLFLILIGLSASTVALSNEPEAGAKPNKTATCHNLHKVVNNDVDDLLKQMYDNLDSTCLFDMPTDELERIWGIKVFDFVEDKSDTESTALGEQFHAYNKSNNAIFVKKHKDIREGVYLMVSPTEVYLEKNNGIGGNMGQGKFPAHLPQPSKIHDMPSEVSLPSKSVDDNKPSSRQKDSVYDAWSFYYWWQGEPTKDTPFLLIMTGMDGIPANPTFYKSGYKPSFSE